MSESDFKRDYTKSDRFALQYFYDDEEKKAKEMTMDQSMVICLSGRGDKDVNTIADYLDGKGYLN